MVLTGCPSFPQIIKEDETGNGGNTKNIFLTVINTRILLNIGRNDQQRLWIRGLRNLFKIGTVTICLRWFVSLPAWRPNTESLPNVWFYYPRD